jgi:hypothetical protein
MDTKKRSNITFFLLLATLAIAAGLNSFLPQGEVASQIPQSQIPKWLIASVSAVGTLVIYGILGFIDLTLWQRIRFPNIRNRDQDPVYFQHRDNCGFWLISENPFPGRISRI